MDRKLISHRIGSILDDISRLSNALYALDTTDIQRYPDNYETLSIKNTVVHNRYNERKGMNMCTVREIREAIQEDCRSQRDMESTEIDRVFQTLPFSQERDLFDKPPMPKRP